MSSLDLAGSMDTIFTYCEDFDICTRVGERNCHVTLLPWVRMSHDVRRISYSGFQHPRWHVISASRFFVTHHHPAR